MMETANNKTLKRIIEALLFSSEKPLNPAEIRSLLPDETLPNIRKALDELKADYETLDRSYDIREVSQGYQFRTKADYGPYIRKMFKQTPSRLSKAAMETLESPDQNRRPQKHSRQAAHLRHHQKIPRGL
jgi:segregation and condensation protein B